jgi:hypothetical protein
MLSTLLYASFQLQSLNQRTLSIPEKTLIDPQIIFFKFPPEVHPSLNPCRTFTTAL